MQLQNLNDRSEWVWAVQSKQEANVDTDYFTTGLKDGWRLGLISPQQMRAHMRETIQTTQRAGDLWCCPNWCLLTCTRYQTIAFAPQQAKGNPAALKPSSGPLHASKVGFAPTYCFPAWWRSAFSLWCLFEISSGSEFKVWTIKFQSLINLKTRRCQPLVRMKVTSVAYLFLCRQTLNRQTVLWVFLPLLSLLCSRFQLYSFL